MLRGVTAVRGGGAVLAWTVMAACALAQSHEAADWTSGVPVEPVPDSELSLGVDGLARMADEQRLDRALFSGTEGLVAAQQRGVWRRQADGSLEQIRIRWAEEATPLPEGSIERARFEAAQREVSYVRAWPLVSGEAGNVQVELTPHAGVGVRGDGEASAEAGATIRVGQLEVADGRSYDDDQGRWYLFAAGTGTAVGMNWVRGMDGWDRHGVSHDSGSFIGDAQIGVAWRQGDTQTSFGYVHREITAEGVHGGTGIDRDATQGFVALQFSIRPDW